MSGLPNGWESAELGEIADIKGGLAKSKNREPGAATRPVPFLRVANVQRGYLDLGVLHEIEATEAEIKDLALQPGDVLLNEGGDRDKLGRGWVWEEQVPLCIHQNHVFRARPKPGVVDPYYLSYWANTSEASAYFLSSGTQTTNLASINKSNLSRLPVPLPPLPEQRRIAAILNKAEALRTKRRTALAKLDTLAQSIFIEMFGDPHLNIRKNKWAPISELGRIVTGGTPSSNLDGVFGGPVPFVTPGDLESDSPVKRTLTDKGAAEVRTVRAGSTLVCCIGATIGKMGKAQMNSAFNQQINAIEWGPLVDDCYGFQVMRFYKAQIRNWGASTTLPILKKSSFEKIEIPVPPIKDQTLFSDRRAAVEQLGSSQNQSLASLEDLFEALQHRAFRGEL